MHCGSAALREVQLKVIETAISPPSANATKAPPEAAGRTSTRSEAGTRRLEHRHFKGTKSGDGQDNSVTLAGTTGPRCNLVTPCTATGQHNSLCDRLMSSSKAGVLSCRLLAPGASWSPQHPAMHTCVLRAPVRVSAGFGYRGRKGRDLTPAALPLEPAPCSVLTRESLPGPTTPWVTAN